MQPLERRDWSAGEQGFGTGLQLAGRGGAAECGASVGECGGVVAGDDNNPRAWDVFAYTFADAGGEGGGWKSLCGGAVEDAGDERGGFWVESVDG